MVKTANDVWEYLLIDETGTDSKHGANVFKPDLIAEMMNAHGSDGWELVHITESPHLIRMYFKRKKV